MWSSSETKISWRPLHRDNTWHIGLLNSILHCRAMILFDTYFHSICQNIITNQDLRRMTSEGQRSLSRFPSGRPISEHLIWIRNDWQPEPLDMPDKRKVYPELVVGFILSLSWDLSWACRRDLLWACRRVHSELVEGFTLSLSKENTEILLEPISKI